MMYTDLKWLINASGLSKGDMIFQIQVFTVQYLNIHCKKRLYHVTFFTKFWTACDNWQQFQNCQPNITESKTFSSIYYQTAKMPCCGLQNLNYHYSKWRNIGEESHSRSHQPTTEMVTVTTIAAAAGFSEFQRDTL